MIKITPNTRIFCPQNEVVKGCFINVFELGKCETCGNEVIENNFIGTSAGRIKELLSAGVKEINHLPPEMLWNDRTKQYDCEKCRKPPEISSN